MQINAVLKPVFLRNNFNKYLHTTRHQTQGFHSKHQHANKNHSPWKIVYLLISVTLQEGKIKQLLVFECFP